MRLWPGQIMTHHATSSSLMTTLDSFTLSWLGLFPFPYMIGNNFMTHQSYSWCTLTSVAFDWRTRNLAIRELSTGMICVLIVRYNIVEVDAAYDSLTMISDARISSKMILVGRTSIATIHVRALFDIQMIIAYASRTLLPSAPSPFLLLHLRLQYLFYNLLSSFITFVPMAALSRVLNFKIHCNTLCYVTSRNTHSTLRHCSSQTRQQTIVCWPSVIVGMCCVIPVLGCGSTVGCTAVDVTCLCGVA